MHIDDCIYIIVNIHMLVWIFHASVWDFGRSNRVTKGRHRLLKRPAFFPQVSVNHGLTKKDENAKGHEAEAEAETEAEAAHVPHLERVKW